MQKVDLKSMTFAELQQFVEDLGEKKFRTTQLYQWMHQKMVKEFASMTNLSAAFRDKLEEQAALNGCTMVKRQISADGTNKFLMELSDGNKVESVLMKYHHGNSVCISTQVGCRMGCRFCASTQAGRVRNLEAGEICSEIYTAQKDIGERISHIVLMGIGEPLDNFDTVLRFLELVNSPDGLNIGMRHISLSTCGLTEKIDKLADYQLQLTLSVSLHAPDDETRSRIMPVNRSVGVEKLFAACRRYFEKTGRRISYEYAMIDGVNDNNPEMQALIDFCQGTLCHVNLIQLNDVPDSPLKPSPMEKVETLQRRLTMHGVETTIRNSRGNDIDAACGQLKQRFAVKKSSDQ